VRGRQREQAVHAAAPMPGVSGAGQVLPPAAQHDSTQSRRRRRQQLEQIQQSLLTARETVNYHLFNIPFCILTVAKMQYIQQFSFFAKLSVLHSILHFLLLQKCRISAYSQFTYVANYL
jgi:hypothetical protein